MSGQLSAVSGQLKTASCGGCVLRTKNFAGFAALVPKL